MEEKPINEQESLEIISQMIQSAKTSLSDDGIYFLLWGCAVFLCAMTQFILIEAGINNSALVWPVMMIAAGVASGIIGKSRARKLRIKTFVEEAIHYVWIAFGISLFILLVFANINMNSESVYPVI